MNAPVESTGGPWRAVRRRGGRVESKAALPDRRKVLLVQWGNSGAGPRLLFELAHALVSSGEVDLVVSFNPNSELGDRFPDLGVPMFDFPTYRNKVQLVLGIPLLLVRALKFRRWIQEHEIELAYSPMFSIWQSIALYVYLPKSVRFLASVHDAQAHIGEESKLLDFSRALEIRRANGLVTFSDAVGDEMTAKSTTRILRLVHPAFGIGRRPSVRSLPVDRPIRIGFFGRILAYKGVDILAEAFSHLVASGVDVELNVVGDGDRELIRDFVGLPNSIWDIRWVPEGEVNSIVGNFDVLVLPYREASQSGVLAVALAEGVPSVVTPVGGLPQQVTDTGCGLVASAPTAEAVASALAAMCSDPSAYLEYSQNCLEAASGKYSWDTAARRLGSFIDEMASSDA